MPILSLKWIALLWTLFQVLVASFWELNSTYVRYIHLLFALIISLCLAYNKSPSFFSKLLKIFAIGFILFSSFYYFYDVEAFFFRSGFPNFYDKTIAIGFVIVLLFMSGFIIGKAIVLVALGFLVYCLFASHMPSFFSFKSASLGRLVGQVFMSDQGIFGIPLDVSANIVFLFVLLGAFLEKTGGGKFFINLALSLVGRYRGGAAKAAVLGSGLTGMISGSSIANIVTTGTFTIPLMKKVGYPAKKAAAIEVAASTDGQIAPPIMGAAAFIMAATLKTDYLTIIKAALIPALVSNFTLFFITHLEALKHNIRPLTKKEYHPFFNILKQGWIHLFPIALLLYFLVIERKSAVFSVLIALSFIFLTSIIHPFYQEKNKDKNLKQKILLIINLILDVSYTACKNMLSVALATASAGIIIAVVSLGLGSQINSIVEALSLGNIFLLLFFTALISLIVGMGLPTTATYIVMSSLTAPVIVSLSAGYGFIIPILSAHLFCFYFGILADDTPPVGLAAYTASAIAESEPIKTGIQSFSYDIRTAIIPFMFILNPDIVLVNISSIPQVLLILLMTSLASFAFASALQRFFLKKNDWLDTLILIFITIILFYPKILSPLIPYIHHYFFYLVGIALIFILILKQKLQNSLK